MPHKDELPTIWPITPHTKAKHNILRKYLQAWFRILTGSNWPSEVLYIDGFAGPGEYEGGEPGSPLIAIEEAARISLRNPLRMVFVEARKDRYNNLQRLVNKHKGALAASVSKADCNVVIPEEIAKAQSRGATFGPALAFLDQFGYGEVPISLVAQILNFKHCEVFSYLDYKGMNRWMTDEKKWPTITAAFGGEEWKACLKKQNRLDELCRLYAHALETRGGAEHVQQFLMYDNDGPIYWLFFCTNHWRGLEEMKRAMWAVDGSGGFRFSDRDAPGQLSLLGELFGAEWLAAEIFDEFRGQTVVTDDVRLWVLTKTPCYLYKGPLGDLETEKLVRAIDPPPGRKARSFPDGMQVEFREERPLKQQTMF